MSAPAIAAGLRRARAAQPDRVMIVAIDGPSGAGKSTLAGGLAAEIGTEAAVVAVDDFYADLPWTERGEFSVQEALARDYDWPRLRDQVLAPARAGAPELTYQRYDWDREQMGDWVTLATPGILIVEGVSSLRTELRGSVDLGVFVDAPRKLRLRRQRQRHALYPPEIRVRQDAMIERWTATEDHYLATMDPRGAADFVVETRS